MATTPVRFRRTGGAILSAPGADGCRRKEMALEDLEEVRRVKEAVESDLMQWPGVTGVDVGRKRVGGQETGALAIRIYVQQKRDLPQELALPTEIQGIPTDVVERSFEPHAARWGEGAAATPDEGDCSA